MMDKEQFKQARIDMGLTQLQMADKLGVCVRTVQRWESGNIKIPTPIVKLLRQDWYEGKDVLDLCNALLAGGYIKIVGKCE